MNNTRAVPFKIVRWVVIFFLCIGYAASKAMAGESAYNPPPSYYYCTSDPAAHSRYYSAMFKVPGKGVDYQQIANGFGQFLEQKYGFKSAAVCFGDPNQNQAQSRIKQQVGQLRMSKWSLIQTTWTYNGAPSEGMAMDPSPSSSASSSTATAKSNPESAIGGIYIGSYSCAKGPTDLKLELSSPEYGLLRGTFTFYLPPGSHTKAYTFSLNGHFDPKSGSFNLNPLKWETPAPPNYMMVSLKGAVDAQGGKVSGIVDYSGCGRFEAMKGRDD